MGYRKDDIRSCNASTYFSRGFLYVELFCSCYIRSDLPNGNTQTTKSSDSEA